MRATNPPPIAVQLYTLREECATDFAGVLQRVASMGYVGVELAGFNDLTPDEFGRVLADTGLRLASAHQGLDPADDFEPALDTYKSLGSDTVVVPMLLPDDFASADAVARSADRLNAANEQAKARSLTLGYHNHFWELQQSVDDRPALLALFDRLDPGIVAEVDIYWARVGGVDPAELLRELGDRVGMLHVKDGPAAGGGDMVAVGDGEIDIPAALAAAPSAQWHIVELDQCATSMEAAVAKSHDYLVGNGLSTGRAVSRVAIVGCGVIAPAYATTLRELGNIEIVAVADMVAEKAQELATLSGARVATLDEILGADDIDAVVNLTPPKAHAAVTRATLEAGRAAFSEKPLGIDFAEGRDLVRLADQGGLRLGCAPDTFLGAGLQTARAVIDRGDIGEPVAATAAMLQGGPEWWHPDPDFFYKRGAGPLFDMGPYYFTALVQLLGPARTVTGAARISRAQRPINSEPRRGEMIDVEVPTHVASVIEHASGPISTLVISFDVLDWRNTIEIYGTEGILAVPDPNTFGGPVRLRRAGEMEWTDVPLDEANVPQSRGIGLADMMWAQRTGRAHRASADLALHVLELMTGTVRAAESGQRLDLTTTCERAAALPVGLPANMFDD